MEKVTWEDIVTSSRGMNAVSNNGEFSPSGVTKQIHVICIKYGQPVHTDPQKFNDFVDGLSEDIDIETDNIKTSCYILIEDEHDGTIDTNISYIVFDKTYVTTCELPNSWSHARDALEFQRDACVSVSSRNQNVEFIFHDFRS